MKDTIRVEYFDDYGFKHLCFVTTQSEIAWLQMRFGKDSVKVFLDN